MKDQKTFLVRNPSFLEFTENISDVFQPTLINQPFSTKNLQNFPITFIFYRRVHRMERGPNWTVLKLDDVKEDDLDSNWTVQSGRFQRSITFGLKISPLGLSNLPGRPVSKDLPFRRPSSFVVGTVHFKRSIIFFIDLRVGITFFSSLRINNVE